MRRRILLTLLVLTAVISAVRACPASDRAALTAFRTAMTEPYTGIFDSWAGPDCRTWYGVSCDPETGRVVDINLRGESEDPILAKSGWSGYMAGTLSPELCRLDRLANLIVADWKAVSGPIPDCLAASLPSLRVLDLVGNRISGRIPAQIGSLRRLAVLNLADNALTGPIPASLVRIAGLKHLDLAGNALTGPIPSDFGALRMLSRALLARNRLTGPVPGSVSGMDRLADLDLSTNRISGPIPGGLGQMRVLSTLNLDGNMISGTIPPSLLSSGIGILNLSRNSLEGNVPDVFTPRTYLMALDLSHNNLKGPIPGSLSSAKYIGHLDLSHNHLGGAIPLGSPFDHLEASSFASNDCLCGNPLRTTC